MGDKQVAVLEGQTGCLSREKHIVLIGDKQSVIINKLPLLRDKQGSTLIALDQGT